MQQYTYEARVSIPASAVVTVGNLRGSCTGKSCISHQAGSLLLMKNEKLLQKLEFQVSQPPFSQIVKYVGN